MSGGISMFISMFKVEVELPKHIKSEVIRGHSKEHVQKTIDYMGLESKKELGTCSGLSMAA